MMAYRVRLGLERERARIARETQPMLDCIMRDMAARQTRLPHEFEAAIWPDFEGLYESYDAQTQNR